MNILFDLLAPLYDRVMRPPKVDAFVEALGLPNHGLLLDAGGGTGRVSRLLLAHTGGVVVCDASLPMLARAHARGLGAALAHAEQLPFSDGAFARVLVVDALHHFRRQDVALAELSRVLAPGGRLLISEPDICRARVRLIALGERLALMGSRFLVADEVVALLRRGGLPARVRPGTGLSYLVVADRPPDAAPGSFDAA